VQHPQSHWSAPPPAPPAPPEPTIHVSALIEALKISNVDKEDIKQAMALSESVPLRYRLRAGEIIRTTEFRSWASTPESRELLVQPDPRFDTAHTGDALSLVTASLMENLRSRERFVSLVFFCGRHTEYRDAHAGGGAMVRSFIVQLLEQSYPDFSFPQREVDLEGVRAGDVAILCALLEWLVRWLPKKKTLVCVVDGVGMYERPEYEKDMRAVVDSLLRLARGNDPEHVVKVLATSPTCTVGVHNAFKSDDSSHLLMERLEIVSDTQAVLEIED
jgi:hypothetical protein